MEKVAGRVELGDGRSFTIRELRSPVVTIREAYVALFPNDVRFFFHVYRLCGIDRDEKIYRKPYIVSQIMRRIIYTRFSAEVLPTLEHLNPISRGGFRQYKLSQYLDKDGKKMLIKFRDEAIEMMETYPYGEWYRFEKDYAKKHGITFQLNCFKERG